MRPDPVRCDERDGTKGADTYPWPVRWFRSRGRVGTGSSGGREAERATREHLAQFVRTREGVEAYVEPETRSTPMTVVLVAVTGEWTRRRVPGERAARRLAAELGIPVYDVHLTGYPARMRAWSSRRRAGDA